MKERLLGAAVLIAAAIIIIPALLDGPPQERPGEARELALPAPESPGLRTHVVDLDENAPQPARTPAARNVAPLPAAPATASPSPAAPPPRADVPERAGAENIAAAATRPAAEVQAWAVQVGSFSSETNARRLSGLLESSDYPAFVVRHVVDGRVMYRVRVGPEADRERAEALAERLRDDRQQAQLVRHP